MSVITEFEGLAGLENYFRRLPAQTTRAASLAINQVLQRSGMRMITDEIYEQVAFPKGYLKGDKIGITKFASANSLEGVIKARKRATSMARFAAPGTPLDGRGRGGVTVKVKAGRSVRLRSAWLIRLRKGASLTEDNYNVGLAVRVRPGDQITSKKTTHVAWYNKSHTVALLYGPSVDQVFRDVADDTGPKILDLVAAEFFRQFDRIS